MNRKFLLLALVLVGAVVPLTSCGNQAAQTTPTPEPPSMFTQAPPMLTAQPLPEGIDPSAEEDVDPEYVDDVVPGAVADAGETEAPSTQFAGATPVPLDPIDMPSPTPRQPLVFTYASYTAGKLGLTFESVAGYTVDDTASETYILREPQEQMRDNYPVEITITITPVVNNYAKNDIRRDLRGKLADLGKVNYQTWQPSEPAERSLLKAPGYYGNYRGVMTDGTIVRGRVHMALLPGNRLLTLHITNPANYNTDYDTVYSHIRSTLKVI